jgi:hypothetical protein
VKRLIAVLFVLLLADAPALAAVAYDAVSSSACTGCSSDSWSHTTTGANTFMACGSSIQDFIGSTTISAFTYNSVSLASENSASNNIYFARLYKLAAAATGANTVAITYNQIANSATGCMTFTGVDPATPTGTSVTDNSSTGSLSASITIPANGMGASIAAYDESLASCSDSTSGQTERYEVCNDDFGIQGMGSNTASTGSVAMTWTLNATNPAAMVAVPINELVVGAATRPRVTVVE